MHKRNMSYKTFFLSCAFILFSSVYGYAGLIDRVSAYVGDDVITLGELEDAYQKDVNTMPGITRKEVLNTMINRAMLLREAHGMRLEAPDDEALIREYIDIKVGAFIIIKEEDIEGFYKEHKADFKGLKFVKVRDKIEKYLMEKELNQRLKMHIEELKAKTYIRIIYIP